MLLISLLEACQAVFRLRHGTIRNRSWFI